MKITDEMLVAYLKGDLPREDRGAVEAAIAGDPEVAERLRGHRVIGELMHGALTGPPVDDDEEPPAVRLSAPVVSLQAARAKRAEPTPKRPAALSPPSRPIDPRWITVALSLAAGAVIGLFVPRPETGLITRRLEAAGPLAVTLQTKLAVEQDSRATIRIGRTFRAKGGAWCRTFSSSRDALAGVACREGGLWRLRMAESGAGPQPSAAVLATVGALTDGQPVDAAAERSARATGWR